MTRRDLGLGGAAWRIHDFVRAGVVPDGTGARSERSADVKRVLAAALAGLTLAACGVASPGGRVEDASACIPPASPGSAAEGSLPVLVDRAEIIATVTVTKAERTYAGYRDQMGARRLTLRTLETLKGTSPGAEFVVNDGPCPAIVGTEGESFVAFLATSGYYGPGLQPMGLPISALRPTGGRTLAQIVAAIRAVRPLDGDARALFAKFGWTAGAAEGASEFELPPLAEFRASREIIGAAPALMGPLDQHVAVSFDIGLDLRVAAGKRVELLSLALDRKAYEYVNGAATGHVLILDRRIVGAWVAVIPQGGPFSIRDRAGALASNGDPPSFPPKNRFAEGINVAAAYGLSRAAGLSYKTGGGRAGDVDDAARVRELAAALDRTLPTAQAVWNRDGTPTTYYLHFLLPSSHVSFVYDSATGVLISVNDGWAVTPGPVFAALIAALK
jgi:hypothetical protein